MADRTNQERLQRSVLHIARCILEAVTPLSLSTGNPDGVFDTALVTDANDLPAIPGTSLAGVLRHLWHQCYGDQIPVETLFGRQEGASGDPSRLVVSWGLLLDSEGKAAEGLLPVADPARLHKDELLSRARALCDEPLFRNRVCISHRGAAAEIGKFDRALLPRGNRFAIELRLWSGTKDDPDWDRLLDLLGHAGFRLGGATRAGLGKMRLVSCHRGSFDLADKRDAKAFLHLGRAIDDTAGLAEHSPRPSSTQVLSGTLKLTPRGFWRIGQGDLDLRELDERGLQGLPADLLPVTEELVAWHADGKPRLHSHSLLLPASSLKGALAHRMSFHANRFSAPPVWAQAFEKEPSRPAVVDALLGSVKGKGDDSGRAGALLIDDAFIALDQSELQEIPHNAIDRFTGGVRNRVLYSEQSLFRAKEAIAIPIALDLECLTRSQTALGADPEAVRRALRSALDDLCQGRLALGSRTTTGNGFFDGRLEGEFQAWLDAEPETNQEAA